MSFDGLIKTLFLFVPMLYLGYLHLQIFVLDNPDYKIRRTTLLSLLGYVTYLSFLFSVGPTVVEDTLSNYNKGKSFWAYLMPGIGFAMAAFPYEASRLSDNLMHFTASETNDAFAMIGWLAICAFTLKLII